VTGRRAGVDTITYTQGGCAVSTTVTVNLTPSAITGAGNICAGTTSALSDAITGGVWATSAGLPVGCDGHCNGRITGDSNGYLLTGAGCAVTKIITVNPISAITGGMGICLGTTTHCLMLPLAAHGKWFTGIATVNSIGVSPVC